jgi:hypothetical protein
MMLLVSFCLMIYLAAVSSLLMVGLFRILRGEIARRFRMVRVKENWIEIDREETNSSSF